MQESNWVSAGLVFLAVAASVVAVAWLWERWRQRREWRRTATTVAEATGKGREEAGAAPTALLKREAPSGALGSLALFQRLDVLLEQAAVSWGIGGFLARAGGIGGVLALILLLVTGSVLAVPLALGVGVLLPYLQLRRARAKRLRLFEEQFPEAVDLLARAIRAGHPFSAGLKMVAEEAAEPVAGEFRRLFEEQRFGLGVQETLQGLAQRMDLTDVRIFVTAVSIQREVGGNLAEILDQISETIRERFKIQRQVAVYTAQGRMTGILLSLLPVGLGLLLTILNPGYMGPLFRESAGQMMLGAAAVMQVVGYLLIRRITTIEV